MAGIDEKACKTPTCAMRDLKVTTDKDRCLACGELLRYTNPLRDVLKGFTGGFPW